MPCSPGPCWRGERTGPGLLEPGRRPWGTSEKGVRLKISSDLKSEYHDLWGERAPVVGMVHLLPLPGSPGWRGSMDQVRDRACRDATALAEGRLDGILVENYGDMPFFPSRVPPETVAAMAVLVREVVRSVGLPVGVNVLRNDAEAALSVGVAAGARFMRVNVHTGSMFTDQGLLEGRAHRTLRRRHALGASIPILADVMVKHAAPPPGLTLESAARDTLLRGLADGLILTGTETGRPVDLEALRRIRAILPPDAKVWVGSGVTPETAASTIKVADGIIVGSALQAGGSAGGGIDAGRVRRFMEALDRS
jgi:membrane complex biogenesis BtpA family protein